MAINFLKKTCDKIDGLNNSSGSIISSSQLLQLSLPGDQNSSTKSNKIRKNKNANSPYLADHSVQLLSRVTEKRLVHKKAANIISSFPLAVNLYKASSDEFKSQRKGMKKVKKSVLTLPNLPAKIPQTCTVSDMNDSEYFNASDDHKILRTKKQKRKAKVRNRDYEFYDRDARYCSQMNINCNSIDVVNRFTGDCKSICNNYGTLKKTQTEKEFSTHDMWTLLRNMNRFQFRPSPPVSDDSIKSHKKKTRNKKRNDRKDTRVVETCRTEEFAYISSFEIDNKSPSFSQSSFDRITVIDKQDEFNEICAELERNIVNTNNLKFKNRRHILNRSKNVPITSHRPIRQKNNKNIYPIIKNHNQFSIKEIMDENQDSIEGNKYCDDDNYQCRDNRVIKKDEGIGFIKNIEKINKITGTPLDRLHSGSSKIGVNFLHNNIDNNERILKVSSDESAQQIKGITKVILSTGQNIDEAMHNDFQKEERRPGLVTTMPSSGVTPKLTQTDIKRRLANMRFPIVILGKDQLGTASIEVADYEAPQFDGLTKHIWPFMQDWYDQRTPLRKLRNTIKTDDTLDGFSKCKRTILPRDRKIKNNTDIIETKLNKSVINATNERRRNNRKKCLDELSEIIRMKTQSKKSNPLDQLKDKMVKLLYKNNSAKRIEEQNNKPRHINLQDYISTTHTVPLDSLKKSYANTETIIPVLSNTALIKPSLELKKSPPMFNTYPWAKRKRASDFIDTVIRKIHGGVYYNQEQVDLCKIDLKEVSIQTTLVGTNIQVKNISTEGRINKGVKTIDCFNLAPFIAENSVDKLPGFDESPPVLEIKTLNMKELSIKHCTTNVMLQFDITIPSESNYHNAALKSSLVPLTITESHTKIFKCQTTIMNAMLPAEICSILPTLLKTIMDANRLPIPALTSYQNDTTLYTISELSRSESPELVKYTIPTVIGLSSTLTNLLEGIYSYKLNQIRKKKMCEKLRININRYDKDNNVLASLQPVQHVITPKVFVTDYITLDIKTPMRARISTGLRCNALYMAPKRNSVTEDSTCINFGVHDFTNLMKHIWNQKLSIRFKISMPLDTLFQNNEMHIDMQVEDKETKRKTFSIDSLKMNSLFIRYNKSNGIENKNNSICKAIEYKNILCPEKTDKKEIHGVLSNSKTRMKRFVKLYKKCKSTTNISGERSRTSISKITTLDDFFQALGAGKVMSSVFYGKAGNKILSAILEMKNWMTEISQRQAMLVLLLINKKDTPNLVRFRPILLQGIAVNRITQASELDMEIEVIERENFNKFSTYDGTSYLPEPNENRENLLEELYWIAKTTASDYQKPFNESSEKLLKSLLEKRKKLNPSYLRVMARYVGLGLLKEPRKK